MVIGLGVESFRPLGNSCLAACSAGVMMINGESTD
jgi:hypothetical protein